MNFYTYELRNDVKNSAILTRPANARYGYQGDKSPANVAFSEAIELLRKAFGNGVFYSNWRDVVEAKDWHNVTPYTWYWNCTGVYAELYLTNELQMNYLSLAMKNVTVISLPGE